ncbi:MAG: hypothetical protein R2705_01860 [Ilumatobacteraceae bacterium]
MVPAGLLLAVSGSVLPLGLFALAIYFLGFEFAIVSAISLASNVVPGRAATGIGLVLGATTVGGPSWRRSPPGSTQPTASPARSSSARHWRRPAPGSWPGWSTTTDEPWTVRG